MRRKEVQEVETTGGTRGKTGGIAPARDNVRRQI